MLREQIETRNLVPPAAVAPLLFHRPVQDDVADRTASHLEINNCQPVLTTDIRGVNNGRKSMLQPRLDEGM